MHQGVRMRQAVAYVSFNGQCVDAFRFYAETLNGHVESVTICADHARHGQPKRVRHAVLHLDGLTIVGQDGPSKPPSPNQYRFALTMEMPCTQKANAAFLALAHEGIIINQLQPFDGNRLGLLIDQFEILWTIMGPVARTPRADRSMVSQAPW